MNALSPSPILTEIAFKNASLLRALRDGGHQNLTAIAEAIGRDKSNVHKSFKLLVDAGFCEEEAHAVTPAGLDQIAALDRADGVGGGVAGVVEIPFDLIDPWAGNPRTQFDPAKTEELAISIGDKGVLQAIKVRPRGARYEVIIGERRRRASALAVARGWQAADFKVPAEIRDYTDDEAEEVAGVENMQREDMHWMDEAKWYLSLSHRHSGAAIERLVGGIRGKRSIQDYIKCARELSPEDVARTYLADDDKSQLTYVRARDLVGEKKERPALELSPKLAAALLETIFAGLTQQGGPIPPLGQTIVTRFAKAPVGGPLSTLSNDRKLIAFGFEAREIVCRVRVTEDLTKWLLQVGFFDNMAAALFKAQAAVVGEMHAATLERSGEYLTAELNGPARDADGLSTIEQHRRIDGTQDGAMDELEDEFGGEEITGGGDGDDARESPAYLRRLAGDHSTAPSPSAAQPAVSSPPGDQGLPGVAGAASAPASAKDLSEPLPAMLEIIVVEVAHKLGVTPLKSPAGGWGAAVLADYYKDARIAQLVQGRKMLAMHPMGEKTLAVQTQAARAYLVETYGLEDEDGRVVLGDAVLQQAQMTLLGARPAGAFYSTPWLNAPPKADVPAEAAADAPAAPQDPDPLTPTQRRILREIAARSLHRHRLLDGWVVAHAAALADADLVALYDLELVTRRRIGDDTAELALTLAGRDHLRARGQAPQDGLSRNSCATPWLRETLAAAAPDEGEAPGAEIHPRAFAEDVRAFTSLAAASRAAKGLLINLRSRSKAPKPEDVEPVVRLIEAALEACAPFLPKDEG